MAEPSERDREMARQLLDRMCVAWNEQDDDCDEVAMTIATAREEGYRAGYKRASIVAATLVAARRERNAMA